MGLFDKIFGKNNNNNNSNNGGGLSNASSNNESRQSIKLDLTKEESLNLLNLRKDAVATLCLKKRELTGLTARVAVVMDYSGSMENLYRRGNVQAILDRLLPLAMQFDDNGEMEVWLFDNNYRRIEPISLNNYYNYINNENILNKYSMGGTKYAPVMQDVINKYTKEEPANIPTLVLFITDGDNFDSDKKTTDRLIQSSSNLPIFWQFVGIGKGPFRYLEKLDDLDGRYIDNANFFSAKDLNQISDKELYDRLLNEYPSWIKEAKSKNILK